MNPERRLSVEVVPPLSARRAEEKRCWLTRCGDEVFGERDVSQRLC